MWIRGCLVWSGSTKLSVQLTLLPAWNSTDTDPHTSDIHCRNVFMYYAIDSSGSAHHSGTRRCAKRGQCVTYPNHQILALCQRFKLKILTKNKSDMKDIFARIPTVPNMRSLEQYDETYSSVLPYVANGDVSTSDQYVICKHKFARFNPPSCFRLQMIASLPASRSCFRNSAFCPDPCTGLQVRSVVVQPAECAFGSREAS